MKNPRDIGKRIAFAGVGSAISLIFVTLAYFVSNMSLSFYVLSSVGIMLPLTQNYYREGVLASVAVSVVGFFIANLKIIPFAMASGFYVVFAVFWRNKNFNRWLGYAIKFLYSGLVFFILYKLTSLFTVDLSNLPKIAALPYAASYAIFNVIFSLAFIVYDILVEQGYIYLTKFVVKKIKR